jgi:hypothetical protein
MKKVNVTYIPSIYQLGTTDGVDYTIIPIQ